MPVYINSTERHTVRVRKLVLILLISALLVGMLVMYVWPSAPPMNTPEHWLDRALRNASAIDDKHTLLFVSRECSNIGDKERGLKAMDAYMREPRLRKFIDDLLVRIGLRKTPRFKAKRIDWYWVAKIQLATGDVASAERSASMMSGGTGKAELYSQIALDYAQAGDDASFDRTIALAVASVQGEATRYTSSQNQIYTACIKAGKRDKAIAIAQAQPDEYKAWEYALLARTLSSEKDFVASREYVKIALSLIGGVEEGKKDKFKSYVAYAMVRNGEFAEANTLIESIPDTTTRSDLYESLVAYQAETGDFAGAYETISRVTRDWSKSGTYWQVAYRLKEYPGKYEEFIDRFLAQVVQIALPGIRARVRINFAKYACLPHNDRIRFRRCIDQALAEAEKAGTDRSLEHTRLELYQRAAIALALAGESREAKALVESFLADSKELAISYLAVAHARAGDMAGAVELFNSVRRFLEGHSSMRYHAAGGIAKALAEAGRLKELDAWIRTLKPIMRAPACLGAARGLIIKQEKKDNAAKTPGH